MTALFLSDVHLRDADSIKTRLVIRFLQEVASRFQRIYLLGDFFDVWPGTTAYLVRSFRPVISVLRRLVEEGHDIHYFEGNHDFRLGEFFSSTMGIKVFPESSSETWEGKRIYLAHGDLGNPRDLGYRALRYILRQNLVHLAIRSIPQEFVFKVGLKASTLSQKYSRPIKRSDASVRHIYRLTAENIFAEGYDMVIMGHTHIPDDVTSMVGGRSCRYINLGDWVKHFTYLEFDGTQFYTRTHPIKNS